MDGETCASCARWAGCPCGCGMGWCRWYEDFAGGCEDACEHWAVPGGAADETCHTTTKEVDE